jgi:hypothetical protein
MEPILNTFVTVAADCPVEAAETPPRKDENPSVAALQFELLQARPYELTLEDLIYEVHRRREHPGKLTAVQAKQIRTVLFSKSHPCMRASPLPKRYGWGVHHDAQGRLAIYARESKDYARYSTGKVRDVQIVAAMRSKRV